MAKEREEAEDRQFELQKAAWKLRDEQLERE